MTMKSGVSLLQNPTMGSKPTKLRIFVLFFAIQLVLCSKRSIILPSKGSAILGKSETIEQRSRRRLGVACHCREHLHHPHQTIRIRGGGSDSSMAPGIIPAIESFFRDTVIPRARAAGAELRQRIDNHLERKSIEREEQLERNKSWRQTAESPTLSSRQKSRRNKVRNRNRVAASTYASSSRVESSRYWKASSSFPTTTTTTTKRASAIQLVSLPTKVLKVGLVAVVVAEILDRTGVLDGDTPELVWAQIEEFWVCEILPAYANARYMFDAFYHLYVKKVVLEFQTYKTYLERKGEKLWQATSLYTGNEGGPQILSSMKVTFAISTACGMILTPMVLPWAIRLWRPVLVLAAISETNHYSKARGRKFVELLGETPQTLGVTLDKLFDRFRKVMRRAIRKMFGSQAPADDCYYEGYGSGNRKSGAVDDRFGDSTSMGLMGGVTARRNIAEMRIRSKYGADAYSLGISAYNDKQKEIEMELSNHRRRTLAKQGLVLGCALGLFLRGR